MSHEEKMAHGERFWRVGGGWGGGGPALGLNLCAGPAAGLEAQAFDSQKPIPTELRGEDRKLRKAWNVRTSSRSGLGCYSQVLDLADDRTKDQRKAMDDEYAYLGVKDPKVGCGIALHVGATNSPGDRCWSPPREIRPHA